MPKLWFQLRFSDTKKKKKKCTKAKLSAAATEKGHMIHICPDVFGQ